MSEWLHHIESVQRGGNSALITIKGWVLAPRGQALRGLRIRTGASFAPGFHGILREDVQSHHRGRCEDPHVGFSVQVAPQMARQACSLEVRMGERWKELSVLSPTLFDDALGISVDAPLQTIAELGASKAPQQKQVLFIGHDHAQAGAQLLLLRFLTWLRAHSVISFDILLNVPRPDLATLPAAEKRYLQDLEALGTVYFISRDTSAPENFQEILSGSYRILYANTSTLGPLLAGLQGCSSPVISHIHELAFWIEARVGLLQFQKQLRATTLFVACSRPVARNLEVRCGVEPDRIHTIHASSFSLPPGERLSHAQRQRLREEHLIGPGDFWVVSCGTFDWRKGADLFIPLLACLRRQGAPGSFKGTWIGSYGSELVYQQFQYERGLAGLSESVQITGHCPRPRELMQAADCFVLLSREDPFPLVMLEAASCGLPLLGFAQTGGIEELAEAGAAQVVPYPDLSLLSTRIQELEASPRTREKTGAYARDFVERHYNSSRSFEALHSLLSSHLV